MMPAKRFVQVHGLPDVYMGRLVEYLDSQLLQPSMLGSTGKRWMDQQALRRQAGVFRAAFQVSRAAVLPRQPPC